MDVFYVYQFFIRCDRQWFASSKELQSSFVLHAIRTARVGRPAGDRRDDERAHSAPLLAFFKWAFVDGPCCLQWHRRHFRARQYLTLFQQARMAVCTYFDLRRVVPRGWGFLKGAFWHLTFLQRKRRKVLGQWGNKQQRNLTVVSVHFSMTNILLFQNYHIYK